MSGCNYCGHFVTRYTVIISKIGFPEVFYSDITTMYAVTTFGQRSPISLFYQSHNNYVQFKYLSIVLPLTNNLLFAIESWVFGCLRLPVRRNASPLIRWFCAGTCSLVQRWMLAVSSPTLPFARMILEYPVRCRVYTYIFPGGFDWPKRFEKKQRNTHSISTFSARISCFWNYLPW